MHSCVQHVWNVLCHSFVADEDIFSASSREIEMQFEGEVGHLLLTETFKHGK